MYVSKLDDTFSSDKKHVKNLCSSADSSEFSLLNYKIGSHGARGYAKVYIFTLANLDDHYGVLSELEPGIGSLIASCLHFCLNQRRLLTV